MHIQSDVTRLYIPRRNDGRGLINICEHYKNAIINFDAYLLNSEEDLLKMASDWQTTRGDKSIHTKAVRYCGEVDKDLNQIVTLTKLTTQKQTEGEEDKINDQRLVSQRTPWSSLPTINTTRNR